MRAREELEFICTGYVNKSICQFQAIKNYYFKKKKKRNQNKGPQESQAQSWKKLTITQGEKSNVSNPALEFTKESVPAPSIDCLSRAPLQGAPLTGVSTLSPGLF